MKPKASTALPSAVPVPGGSFLMGSPLGRPDEAPVHRARVDRFAIAVTPVSNRQYAAFLAATRHPAPLGWSSVGFSEPAQPVIGVSWFDAKRYCRWLSAETGGRWRLPSEAEWERAARGGLEQAPTAWGEQLPPGEIPAGRLAGPWPVGRGTPNGFGLFDVGTVVHEWCRDWYAPYAEGAPGAAPHRQRRASRGGSWRHRVRWSPPSARSSLPPSFRYADYGFRPLREAA